jgi:hypothetical protein
MLNIFFSDISPILLTAMYVSDKETRRLLSPTGPRSEHWGGARIAEKQKNCSICTVAVARVVVLGTNRNLSGTQFQQQYVKFKEQSA